MHQALICAALLAAGTAAAEGRLERGFGVDGFAVEGFQPAASGGDLADADIAIAGCSGPQGSLIVTGLASNTTRIVTIWLTPQGELDTRFSDDGKASFALPAGPHRAAIGLCQADGKPVIAYSQQFLPPDAPASENIHLVRIDAATGLPDAGFGGGSVVVDAGDELGAHTQETPASLTVGSEGDVLLAGSVLGATREHGFVARVRANGQVAAVGMAPAEAGVTRLAAVGLTASGALRVFGNALDDRGEPHDVVQLFMGYDTLHVSESGRWLVPAGQRYRVWSGRPLDATRMALAVSHNDAPALLIAEPAISSWRVVPLPRPTIAGQPAITGLMQLAPSGDGGLIVAHSAGLTSALPHAVQIAKLTGSASGQTVLDPRFGDGGSTLVTWPRPAGCGGPAVLALTRFTFWRGALAVASVVDSSCSSDPDFDYAVFRLDAPLFRDGFDARLPL